MKDRDSIFVVNPISGSMVQVSPTTFYDLNVKERQDLQSWLMNSPDVLGEPLLLIASEFDRFDKSDRRLDLLMLDKSGTLVVAELKLDASKTLADQQAIRYGAFCSTMSMDDVVELYSRTAGITHEDASARICDFLEIGDLPTLNGEPRIMLVAGTFADQELTSTVMWLRKFGIDISCVELTPYRYPGDQANILIVPKVIIPLSEAHEYQIRVERKERRVLEQKAKTVYTDFFRLVLEEFAKLEAPIRGPRNPSNQDYMTMNIGHKHVHYEWLVRRKQKFVDVALHFEAPDQATNLRRLQHILDKNPRLSELFDEDLVSGAWGRQWAQLCLRIPYEGATPDKSHAERASAVMLKLVENTLSAVRELQSASQVEEPLSIPN